EITGGIEDQAFSRLSPVRAAKIMQDPLRPASARCGRQLEHCPACYVAVVTAAQAGRAVEIAGGIEDQATVGIVPVCAVTAEVMQHLLRPAPAGCGRQLE